MKEYSYYIIYKPFQVLSQFSADGNKKTLADFFDVAKDIYPVGRLDYDSEGLLLLTNDKQLNHRLLHPSYMHKRTYYVQVDGAITKHAVQQLQQGVCIHVDGVSYNTTPATANVLNDVKVCERNPPIRYRKEIPTSWISLTLTEGKNRQVRKMTAAVGFPTLRLIRYSIENISIEQMQPGDMVKLSKKIVYKKLFNE